MRYLTRIIGTTLPTKYDILDIFSHIDMDGDQTITREEYGKLMKNVT